ncbi:MAG: ATP-dependent DNA helicase RecG [Pseudomonadota bacterium]
MSDTGSVQTPTVPITSLRGVGPNLAKRFAKLGIQSVAELLFHLPSRYEDRTHRSPIGSLQPGRPALVSGEVLGSQIHHARRRMLVVVLGDGTGRVSLRFFHFSNAQRDALRTGAKVQCYGEVRGGRAGLEMIHPEFSFVRDESPLETASSLTAIYPATEGLSQGQLRKMVDEALRLATQTNLLAELLPRTEPVYSLLDALTVIHQPSPDEDFNALIQGDHPARRHVALEELVAQAVSFRVVRTNLDQQRAPALGGPQASERDLRTQFHESLSFALTGAQSRVVDELRADLNRTRPMYRLVQGDVGSGKTIVAAFAALQAIEGGAQVALMAPTELLAEQHLDNFRRWFEPLGLVVAWLSGRVTGKAREQTLAALATGELSLVIGTQALFQDPVSFSSLGLVIIDEQHRFGVGQRLALREKGARDGSHPHQLIMTATPIPRTLAMTAYADLDVSVIDELPPGRAPVETVALATSRRPDVVARVHHACRSGQQTYWVCPLIEESEAIRSQAAVETAASLDDALDDITVGVVHGRMKSAEKESVMSAFKAGDIDLLVATTVIEVGVDVPNASLMIIENAERLGLAQLHQLRGRVGRGAQQSHCVLLYEPPLSRLARARIAAMRETNDGFEIAERDLELRGPGEVLGTRQTGLEQLRVADLLRDRDLLPEANQVAETLIREHPQRVQPLLDRWLGRAVQYAEV